MATYVDQLVQYPTSKYLQRVNPSQRWCHLTADSVEELHAFAADFGMKREWFQNKAGLPHYDLTPGRRAKAVKAGAIEVDARQRVREMRKMAKETKSECQP